MSSASTGFGAVGTDQSYRRAAWSRPALLGLGLLVVIVAIVLIAHAANGGTAAPSGSSADSSGGSPSSTGSGMSGMTAPTPVPAMGTKTMMTIRGATLPVQQTSGSVPSPMAMVPLASADWDGMSIQARASAPATFILFNGTSQQFIHPTRNDSFHLMVLLSDATTGYAIPYSSVWATITRKGKIVFDERLWPMISRYMGPHYGDNVSLPNAGVYRLTLLLSPPAAARHLEYKSLWLAPHRVHMTFRWVPKT